jgi:hypothetical protein
MSGKFYSPHVAISGRELPVQIENEAGWVPDIADVSDNTVQ